MKSAALSLVLLAFAAFDASADEMAGDAAFVRGDYETALREWRGLAAKGEASAMLGIGTLYDTGHGVPQNFPAALDYYRMAAEAGSVSGAFNVGVMYDIGRGTPVNRAEAVRWYCSAASNGFGRAAYNLGLVYRDGDGVPQDIGAAIQYFRLADKRGVAAARRNLAALGAPLPPLTPPPAPPQVPPRAPKPGPDRAEAGGAGIATFQQAALERSDVPPSAGEAFVDNIATFKELAANGNYVAQYDMGWAYQYGLGVQTDPAKAYVFYLRAAVSGVAAIHDAALKGASEVSKDMTAKQHEAARTMLLESLP